jgi:hypothetical protein
MACLADERADVDFGDVAKNILRPAEPLEESANPDRPRRQDSDLDGLAPRAHTQSIWREVIR